MGRYYRQLGQETELVKSAAINLERGVLMILALYIVGVVVLVISVIAGFLSGSFMEFLIAAAGGVSSGVVFFALAKILENQENILYKLERQEEIGRKSLIEEKQVCPKCNYKYDADSSSCPHCGYRD